MFRASTYPSSGGQIVLSQHLVSSLSVNGCTSVCFVISDCCVILTQFYFGILIVVYLLCLFCITLQPFTESDDTRWNDNTICSPKDGHVDARNMSRIVMYRTYCYRIKEFVHYVGYWNKPRIICLACFYWGVPYSFTNTNLICCCYYYSYSC
jgi:hypothetical protein